MPPRRLTPDSAQLRGSYVDPQHLPPPPPAVAGVIHSPRDASPDRGRRDSEAIDLSLLKLFDGQWMGASDAAQRRKSVPPTDV